MALIVLALVLIVGFVKSEENEESCGHNAVSNTGQLKDFKVKFIL